MSTRRNLLTAAAVSVMLPGVVKAEGISITGIPDPHPDADLLALVDRFLAHEQTIQAMPCNAVPGTPAAVQEEVEQRQIFGVKHGLIMVSLRREPPVLDWLSWRGCTLMSAHRSTA